MKHDTAELAPDEWRSTIPPAEACTEVGQDAEPARSDVRAGLFVVVAITSIWAALLIHLWSAV